MLPGFRIKNEDVKISLDGKVEINSPELRDFIKEYKANHTGGVELIDFMCGENLETTPAGENS